MNAQTQAYLKVTENDRQQLPLIQRCFVTKTTDGTTYVAEFDESSTAAVRHRVIRPDGSEREW